MNLAEDDVPAVSVGRGRGRGRGSGTAILPQGLWSEIVANRDDNYEGDEGGGYDNQDGEDLDERVRKMENQQRQQELHEDQGKSGGDDDGKYADAEGEEGGAFNFIKQGLGGGGGRNGVGRGRGTIPTQGQSQGGLGPGGIQLNKKGVDWNCPSCGNLNWSWRTNCNKCETGKCLRRKRNKRNCFS